VDWIGATIASLGEAMGISELRLNEAGILVLSLDDGGSLEFRQLEQDGERAISLSITLPLSGNRGAAIREALSLSDFRRSTHFQIRPRLRGDRLMLTMKVAECSFVHATAEEAIGCLFRLRDSVLRAA
jgi:hypothetical protein